MEINVCSVLVLGIASCFSCEGSMRHEKSKVYSGFKLEMGEVKEIVEEMSEAILFGDDYSIEKLLRQFNKSSYYETNEEEQDGAKVAKDFVLEPLLPLKEQLEKDKEDESLRRWKEKLLSRLDMESIEEFMELDVKILSLSILSPEWHDIIIPIPCPSKLSVSSFTLKEGSRYSIKLCSSALDNIVSGLTYIKTVWKSGVRVDSIRVMLRTFTPQQESYTYVMDEETTPYGILTRGYYAARTKASLKILEGSYLATQPQIRISIPTHEDLWNNCRRFGSLTKHIQRRRIMDVFIGVS